MSNRKLIRRVLFAAALSASTSTATNASAFQQHRPGEPGKQIPQGNTSVTQELNRMFQESGQPMPSIIAQDLQNANVPIQGPRPPQNQMVNHSQSPSANQSQNQVQVRKTDTTSKPSLIGRLFGKLRGDTAGNNPNYRPPVPPDFKPAPAIAASNGSVQHQTPGPAQAAVHPSQNANQNQMQKQPAQNSNQSMATQPQYGNRQQTRDAAVPNSFRNGASSEIPPRSGATVQTMNTPNNAASKTGATADRTGFTQPGSAPAFMSTVGSSAVIQKQPAAVPSSENTLRNDFLEQNSPTTHDRARSHTKVQKETPSTAVAPDGDDKFNSPFLDAADSNTESDILDLDSLIDIPAGPPVTESAASLNPQQLIKADSPQTKAEEVQEESLVRPDENPFTGVQLNIAEAEFFADDRPVADSSLEGIPLTPMEDFKPDLPAMELPPNDLPALNLPAISDKPPAVSPKLNHTTDSARMPAVDLTLPAEDNTPARAELNAIPDVPAAMSEAETEQLRQTAEQERQQRQRRLIQARAGQTGFKGFCPIQLRERRALVEASDQFTSTFGLQTYSFSSAEAKASFDVEPSRYAPAAGGSDVVVLVNSGEEQPGLLDYAVWYRDRLYMFRSRETMTLFSKDPQRFASQY